MRRNEKIEAGGREREPLGSNVDDKEYRPFVDA